jgi:hypothetical protein
MKRPSPKRDNVLCAVEELPQGLVYRLDEVELREYSDFYVFVFQNLLYGPVKVEEIETLAKDAGIDWRTVEDAKRRNQ